MSASVMTMLGGSLADIPIVQTEMVGPGAFCKLVDNMEMTADFDLVKRRGQHILCNAAGFELLKAEAARRNLEGAD